MAATLQRKCSSGILSVIISKVIRKGNVPRNYFVVISARMVVARSTAVGGNIATQRYHLTAVMLPHPRAIVAQCSPEQLNKSVMPLSCLMAQCSAIFGGSVAATRPCSAIRFCKEISPRH